MVSPIASAVMRLMTVTCAIERREYHRAENKRSMAHFSTPCSTRHTGLMGPRGGESYDQRHASCDADRAAVSGPQASVRSERVRLAAERGGRQQVEAMR